MGMTNTVPAQIIETGDDNFLRLARKPEALVAEASMCANALLAAVRKNGWAQKFGGGKDHLFFEAWSFLATMYRVTPRIRETRLIQIADALGYEAVAEAFHIPTGSIIGVADAMCLNDEDNWSLRPEYEWQGPQGNRTRVKLGDKPVPLFQLRSMAQTRAMAKALKGPFSWIVAMAGYAPQPVEDMGPNAAVPAQQPQRSTTPRTGVISEPQGKRFWALAKASNKSEDEVRRVLQHYGFESTKDITVEQYDAICQEIQRSDAQ